MFLLLNSKMKVIAMPEIHLHKVSLRKAMNAARFFS